jgi:CRISPR-associated protein Cas1
MGRSYYVFSSGRIRRKENTLFLENEGGKKAIPIEDVSDLYFFGELDLNTKLVCFLSQKEITIHFFNYYGFYTGSFYPRSKNEGGFITLKQAEHYLDDIKRISLAREMIKGASHNILKNMQYYNNRDRDLEAYISQLQKIRDEIDKTDSINSLLGLEGNVRKTYYKAFDEIIAIDEKMGKRIKHPPNNMINCLISFGNSLLYTCCLSEIYRTHLNPTISYFHSAGEKRYSLSLDLADIFKPVITDKIIFSTLNKGIIKKTDFDKRLNYCYLKEKGRKKFVREFDEKIKTTIKHRKLNREVSHKRLIRLECYKIIKHLSGDEKYKSFKAWW